MRTVYSYVYSYVYSAQLCIQCKVMHTVYSYVYSAQLCVQCKVMHTLIQCTVTPVLTCVSVSLISGLFVGQYLQRITSNLALGGELLYQFGPQVPGGEISVLSLAGRLTGKLALGPCPRADCPEIQCAKLNNGVDVVALFSTLGQTLRSHVILHE